LAVKLRLKRFGRLNHPTYRICAADSRWPRDGRIIETLGFYLPKAKRVEEQLKVNVERVSHWLAVGAQPSETVRSLVVRAGVAMPVRSRRKKRNRRSRANDPFVPPRRKAKKKKPAPAAAAADTES
jgi:small subunit ribosomal protein S16